MKVGKNSERGGARQAEKKGRQTAADTNYSHSKNKLDRMGALKTLSYRCAEETDHNADLETSVMCAAVVPAAVAVVDDVGQTEIVTGIDRYRRSGYSNPGPEYPGKIGRVEAALVIDADTLLADLGGRQETHLGAGFGKQAGEMDLQQHRDIYIVLMLGRHDAAGCFLEALTGIDQLRLNRNMMRHGEH